MFLLNKFDAFFGFVKKVNCIRKKFFLGKSWKENISYKFHFFEVLNYSFGLSVQKSFLGGQGRIFL